MCDWLRLHHVICVSFRVRNCAWFVMCRNQAQNQVQIMLLTLRHKCSVKLHMRVHRQFAMHIHLVQNQVHLAQLASCCKRQLEIPLVQTSVKSSCVRLAVFVPCNSCEFPHAKFRAVCHVPQSGAKTSADHVSEFAPQKFCETPHANSHSDCHVHSSGANSSAVCAADFTLKKLCEVLHACLHAIRDVQLHGVKSCEFVVQQFMLQKFT